MPFLGKERIVNWLRVNSDNYRVLMKGITWSRDSHGLFDYESRHLTKKSMRASAVQYLIRDGNELI